MAFYAFFQSGWFDLHQTVCSAGWVRAPNAGHGTIGLILSPQRSILENIFDCYASCSIITSYKTLSAIQVKQNFNNDVMHRHL